MSESSNQPQAAELSLDDRIANVMGMDDTPETEQSEQDEQSEVEASEQDGEAAATPEAETFEFELEGQKFTVPKALEKAFMQNSDYTQKTQKLSEDRRNVEMLQQQAKLVMAEQQFRASVAEPLQKMAMIDEKVKEMSSQDWMSMDAESLMRVRAQIDQFKLYREDLQKQVEDKYAEFQQGTKAALDDLAKKGAERIKSRIPSWNTDLSNKVLAHAVETDGYTTEEIKSINDPRHAITLWKAYQFDQLQSKAKAAVVDAKTVKTTPSNPMSAKVKERLAVQKQLNTSKPGTTQHKAALNRRIESIFGG